MVVVIAATTQINIRYGTPNGSLSNLTPRRFFIDGIVCNSMEGWLQSLKYEDVEKQKYCCTLTGHEARQYGRRAPDWREKQQLFWNGVAYDRHSEEYQLLLDRAYSICFSTKCGKDALLATSDAKLIHTLGHSNPRETILTEREFCDRLTMIRTYLQTKDLIP